MRLRWMVIPALVLLNGCAALDPAAVYREAAKKLHFTLDRVEPNLQLAFPLERSRVGLHLTLGVDNPTEVRFHARSIAGNLLLDSDGASHGIGQLNFSRGVDLAPSARTPVEVDLSFAYADLKEAWGALRSVATGARPGTWRLEGQATLEALGFPVTVPFRAQKHTGGQ